MAPINSPAIFSGERLWDSTPNNPTQLADKYLTLSCQSAGGWAAMNFGLTDYFGSINGGGCWPRTGREPAGEDRLSPRRLRPESFRGRVARLWSPRSKVLSETDSASGRRSVRWRLSVSLLAPLTAVQSPSSRRCRRRRTALLETSFVR